MSDPNNPVILGAPLISTTLPSSTTTTTNPAIKGTVITSGPIKDPAATSGTTTTSGTTSTIERLLSLNKNSKSHKKYILIGSGVILIVVVTILLVWFFVFRKLSSKSTTCTTNSDCKKSGEYCDSSTKKCTACPTGLQSSCPDGCSDICTVSLNIPCDADADCITSGQYCNTTTKKCTACPTGTQASCPAACSSVCQVGKSCQTKNDCIINGTYCDPTSNKCISCPTGNQPSCPDGCSSVCQVGKSCQTKNDCIINGTYCDPTSNRCIECPTGNQPYCPYGCSLVCTQINDECQTNSDCTSVNEYCDDNKKCQQCLCGSNCNPKCNGSCITCQGSTPYCYPPNASETDLIGTCSAECVQVSNVAVDCSKYNFANNENWYVVHMDWPASNSNVIDSYLTLVNDNMGESSRWLYSSREIKDDYGGNNVVNGVSRLSINYNGNAGFNPALTAGVVNTLGTSVYQGQGYWNTRDTVGPCGGFTEVDYDFVYCTADSQCSNSKRGDKCDTTTKTCKCGSSDLCPSNKTCQSGQCK
mgnify:CR=1 FL=1